MRTVNPDEEDGMKECQGNTIDRKSNKNGKGYCENVSPTLNTQDRHGICYSVDCRNNKLNLEVTATLQAHNNGGWSVNCTHPVMYEEKMLCD